MRGVRSRLQNRRDEGDDMISLNVQKPEKQTKGNPQNLEVIDCWDTIQGEGPWAGHPAVFIRLAGCNLQCKTCDTDYTTNRRMMPIESIFDAVDDLLDKRHKGHRSVTDRVVITGGEPFRQDIGELCRLFITRGVSIQIETNGTLYQEDFPYLPVMIVCSPKTTTIHPELDKKIHCFKYVIEAGHVDPNDGLPTSVLGIKVRPYRPDMRDNRPIYVQPVETTYPEETQANVKASVKSCMDYGYRLSLQTHKLLGLP